MCISYIRLISLQGDGEAIADTSIESNKAIQSSFTEPKKLSTKDAIRARIRISLEIDLIAVILLITGICTRLYRLEEPRSIV